MQKFQSFLENADKLEGITEDGFQDILGVPDDEEDDSKFDDEFGTMSFNQNSEESQDVYTFETADKYMHPGQSTSSSATSTSVDAITEEVEIDDMDGLLQELREEDESQM